MRRAIGVVTCSAVLALATVVTAQQPPAGQTFTFEGVLTEMLDDEIRITRGDGAHLFFKTEEVKEFEYLRANEVSMVAQPGWAGMRVRGCLVRTGTVGAWLCWSIC